MKPLRRGLQRWSRRLFMKVTNMTNIPNPYVLDALLQDAVAHGYQVAVAGAFAVPSDDIEAVREHFFCKQGASLAVFVPGEISSDGMPEPAGTFVMDGFWHGDRCGWIDEIHGDADVMQMAVRAQAMSDLLRKRNENELLRLIADESDPITLAMFEASSSRTLPQVDRAIDPPKTYQDSFPPMRQPVEGDFERIFRLAVSTARSFGRSSSGFRRELQTAWMRLYKLPERVPGRPSLDDHVTLACGLLAWPIFDAAGISQSTFRWRIARMTVDDALALPKLTGSGNVPADRANERGVAPRHARTKDGELAISVAERNGISYQLFAWRLRAGWSIDRAATRPPPERGA